MTWGASTGPPYPPTFGTPGKAVVRLDSPRDCVAETLRKACGADALRHLKIVRAWATVDNA